jgi:hypothetical protein
MLNLKVFGDLSKQSKFIGTYFINNTIVKGRRRRRIRKEK